MATIERELDILLETVDWFHDELGLTYDEIGAAIDVSERTLRRWRHSAHAPQTGTRQRLEPLQQLHYLLHTVFPRSGDRAEWLMQPNGNLRGRTPLSLLRRGRIGDVTALLGTYANGEFV